MNADDWIEVLAGLTVIFLCSLLDIARITPSPYGAIGGGIGVSIVIFYRHLKP